MTTVNPVKNRILARKQQQAITSFSQLIFMAYRIFYYHKLNLLNVLAFTGWFHIIGFTPRLCILTVKSTISPTRKKNSETELKESCHIIIEIYIGDEKKTTCKTNA